MGYDCTLHLVDEKAIRDVFVPKLLGLSKSKTALDRVLKNAAKLWGEVRKGLAGRDPDEAAALVCRLAVTFSACSLPHQYERGFALSLWADQEKDIAVEYPTKFAFSPELLFSEVVAAHPLLSGRFPTWFDGNYSTGVYIPADHVPAVLAWAEKKVAKFAKGDRRQFKGLLGILRAAADQGLAYWEATDLAVPMADEYPGDPTLMMAGYLQNEATTPGGQVEKAPASGNWNSLWSHLRDDWFVTTHDSPFETNFNDLSVWPPKHMHRLPEFAPYSSLSKDGRWLLLSATDPKAATRTFGPRVFGDLAKPPTERLPVIVDGIEAGISVGVFVGDRGVLYRRPHHAAKAGDVLPSPVWQDGRAWKPVPGLPPAVARQSCLPHFIIDPVRGAVRLADRGEVLLWDQDGYELRGKSFVKTFPLGHHGYSDDWTSVPCGEDGFFYLDDRRLFEAHRGGKPIPHAARWTNIMFVRPGPAGGVLLQEGKNKDGDVGKLYSPAAGTFIHIEPELFDDGKYTFIHWSQAADRFIVLSSQYLSVPTVAVLSLPRYRADTGRRVK